MTSHAPRPARPSKDAVSASAGRFSALSLALSLVLAAAAVPQASADEVPSPAGVGPVPEGGPEGGREGDLAIIGNETRVVGGARTSIVDWPSVVALLDAGELRTPFERQFCGGTVIASRWVLTAAHCLYDGFGGLMTPASLTVLAGQTNLRDPSEGRELVVTNLYLHPGYVNDATGRTRDDIALLELAVEVPAPASELFAGGPEDYPGRLGAIVGWGATEYTLIGRTPFPDDLQVASVPLVPIETCNAPNAYAGDVVAGQFCAGYAEGGVDSCTGDSGGPLYLSVEGRVQLVGVTSFGRGCALPDFYGIYTDVGDYLDWIRTYVELPIEPVAPAIATSLPPDTTPRTPAPEILVAQGGDEDDDRGGFAGAVGPVVLALIALAGRRRRRGLRAGRAGGHGE